MTFDSVGFGSACAQEEVFSFLSDPGTYRPVPETVERIDTHAAVVFLAGSHAYKIKRAVKYPYLDFSTLERRRAACAREVEVNSRVAPQIYLGLVPIARGEDGRLTLDGEGPVVEWAVHMRRFDQDAVLDRVCEDGRLDRQLSAMLANRIAAYHATAPVAQGVDAATDIEGVVEDTLRAVVNAPDIIPATLAERYGRLARRRFEMLQKLLRDRAGSGFVRRCHGDLHLANIVLIEGEPVLFDAIEFDERIATIDVLYDLAFLLMDLWGRDARVQANVVLNGYLHHAGFLENYSGLATLPLFMGLRAAVRAMVTIDRVGVAAPEKRGETAARAKTRLEQAVSFLEPATPVLVAVGGLSGTGKSTLSACLAPRIGAAPGAVHLRSDLERKAQFGVAETTRLGPAAYTTEITRQVYEALLEKARAGLGGGHSAVVDAVFAEAGERAAVEDMARSVGVRFVGIWLEAPEQLLIHRVANRYGDASDATPDVVRRQSTYDVGPITWHRLDASGDRQEVLDLALSICSNKPIDDAPPRGS